MHIRSLLRTAGCEEQGGSLIEAPIVSILLFTLVMGTMDMAQMIFDYNFVSYAAREGSRYASSRGVQNPATATSISTYVKNQGVAALTPASLTINTTWVPDHNSGSVVSVNVSYTFHSLFSFVPSPTFQSTSKMVIAQ